MAESRSQLLLRKRDLYAALRLLEQDREDGAVDEEAYQLVRARYEREAAQILADLDRLPEEYPARPAPRTQPLSRRTFRAMLAGGLLTLLAAGALFLLAATHGRTGTEAATGSEGQGSTSAQQNPRVLAAQMVTLRHPRQVSAWVALGNAQFDAGQTAAADASYLHAMQLAPRSAEPVTLHAMVLGLIQGKDGQALQWLRRAEQLQPNYARAWLLDGLISDHHRSGYPRAIAAWQQFLRLDPHNAMAPRVRIWIRATEKALK